MFVKHFLYKSLFLFLFWKAEKEKENQRDNPPAAGSLPEQLQRQVRAGGCQGPGTPSSVGGGSLRLWPTICSFPFWIKRDAAQTWTGAVTRGDGMASGNWVCKATMLSLLKTYTSRIFKASLFFQFQKNEKEMKARKFSGKYVWL